VALYNEWRQKETQMSASDISRSTALLFPPFAARVAAGLAEAREAGLALHVFEAWRPAARQAVLYAAGRTTPGPKVTNARPGESWHQYGLAVDLAFGGPGRWTWEGDWPAARAIMVNAGLRSLAPYEQAHVEWPTGFPVETARGVVEQHGLLSLWQRIESAFKVT
jgi:peptidoglycan L-alanyl-D-glutamate endopeptidase CwlK